MASATADWRAAFLEAVVVVEEDVGADGACKKGGREKLVSETAAYVCRLHTTPQL